MVSGSLTLVALIISIIFIIFLTARLKVNAFMVLILAGILYGFIVRMPMLEIMKNIQNGFGNTLGYIGIVIIAGTIMGILLEKTGAAFSITNAILKVIGSRFPNLALTIAGYITSIAVFCDSGFVILNSINKSLAKKSNLSITVTSVSLATGLFASHCLIPPATGPIAAAQIIGSNIGLLMLVGAIVGIFAAGVGFIWATFFAKKYYVEPNIAESYEELIAQYGQLPSVGKALMPILVPIILILLSSLANPKLGLIPQGQYLSILFFLGNPAVALIIGVFVALFLLVPRSKHGEAVNEWFTEGIRRAALIVAITGAGGAFGQVLKGSPIGDYLGTTLSQWHLGIFLPFIISAALKTAQGSSTVALITASSIIAPLLPALGLNPVLATAAVGAGAMTFSHANDSYFWVETGFGKNASFFVVWMQWIYNIVWFPSITAFAATHLAYSGSFMLHENAMALSNNKIYVLIVSIAIFSTATFINTRGMKVVSIFSFVGAVLGKLIPMILIVVLALFWLLSGHHTATNFSGTLTLSNGKDFVGLFVVVLFSLMGIEMASSHAGTVKNPRKNFPRALWLTVIFIPLSLMFANIAIDYVVPAGQIDSRAGLMQSFEVFFGNFHAPWMNNVIALSLFIGAFAGSAVWGFGLARYLRKVASDGFLPKYFAKVNKHNVPQNALCFQAFVFVVLCFIFLFMPSIESAYWLLSDLTAQLALIAYMIFFAAAIKLRLTYKWGDKDYQFIGGKVVSITFYILGFFTCFAGIIAGFVLPAGSGISLLAFDTILVTGIGIFILIPIIIILLRKKQKSKTL